MKAGDRVVIFNDVWKLGNEEGTATLAEPTHVEPLAYGCHKWEWWRVRFDDAPHALCSRWVCQECILSDQNVPMGEPD